MALVDTNNVNVVFNIFISNRRQNNLEKIQIACQTVMILIKCMKLIIIYQYSECLQKTLNLVFTHADVLPSI